MEDFCSRFRAARDDGMSTDESLFRRLNNPAKGFLYFTRPLEFLAPEDWEAMLLASIQLQEYVVSLGARFSGSFHDALSVTGRYTKAYLEPLAEIVTPVIDFVGIKEDSPGTPFAFFVVALYSKTEAPGFAEMCRERLKREGIKRGALMIDTQEFTKNN